MGSWTKRVGWVVAWASLLQGLGACTSERVVGDQCPGPYDPTAEVQGGIADENTTIGTSCAPCKSNARLDARGCPTYVTFESCGGDICIGSQRIARDLLDASVVESDGGDDSDAGATEDGDAG